MRESYWSNVLSRRLTRRRALAATGATSFAAALLAACGGGGSGDEPEDPSGLLAPRVDETARGVPGGIMPDNHGANFVSIDPNTTFNGAAFALLAPVYSTLVKYGKAVGSYPSPDTISGDAAESWETSPDGLTVTYKLRANHKFDQRPPTNGRAMNAQDVQFSWDRSVALSSIMADVLRSKSPTGVIDSLTTPDSSTVQVKLAEPYGGIQETLAYWYLYIAPVEADNRFDPKAEARGSGPFYLDRWEPSVQMQYKKNPDWYVKDRPFLDGFTKLFITEQATSDAQFEAKGLWFSSMTQPDVILRMKRDHGELEMRQQAKGGAPGSYPLLFGTKFAKDVRLRQAVSMLMDREAMIDAQYNTNVWSDAGLNVTTFWDGHLNNSAINWIDPSGDELGEGAKYFHFNVEEAKKLLSAAGYKGENVVFNFRANFGPLNVPEIAAGMLTNGGLKIELKPHDANSWRTLKESYGAGYDDLLWSTANSYNDDGFLATKYTTGGKDKVTFEAIPRITDDVLKMRREMDNKKRNDMIKEIQRDLAMEMPDVPLVSTQPSLGYELNWPWLRNRVFTVPGFNSNASSARPYTEYWYDRSKQT
jgi:peptide/nickel transport system substrate-binding protein